MASLSPLGVPKPSQTQHAQGVHPSVGPELLLLFSSSVPNPSIHLFIQGQNQDSFKWESDSLCHTSHNSCDVGSEVARGEKTPLIPFSKTQNSLIVKASTHLSYPNVTNSSNYYEKWVSSVRWREHLPPTGTDRLGTSCTWPCHYPFSMGGYNGT